MAKEIPLSRGLVAIVDDEDYDGLVEHKWFATGADDPRGAYAARNAYEGERVGMVMMHREILDLPDGVGCDHADGNGLNNRRANLRPATQQQNMCNRPPIGGSSPYKGVSWTKAKGKWRVTIQVEGRTHQVGYFDDEMEAAHAYDEAAREHFGDFAWLNFPDEGHVQNGTFALT